MRCSRLKSLVDKSWRNLAADSPRLSLTAWPTFGKEGLSADQARLIRYHAGADGDLEVGLNERRASGHQASTSDMSTAGGRLGFRKSITRGFASGPTSEDSSDEDSSLGQKSPKEAGTPDSSQQPSGFRSRSANASKSTLEAKKEYRKEQDLKRQEDREKAKQERREESALRSERLQQRLREEEEAEAAQLRPWIELVQPVGLNGDLTEEQVGKYVFINPELLPEIFMRTQVKEEELHPRGGCPSFENELIYTSSEAVMYREIIRQLTTSVSSKEKKQMYLTGPPNAGKSVALVCLVNQMRAQGWLVWYIPQAAQLTDGGFFYENSPGVWDTPESARLLMAHLKLGNPTRIARLKTASGQPVEQLIDQAATETDSQKVVDIFLEVKNAVCNADDVLIAIDNYQALYLPSKYGQWMSQHYRRPLLPDELRVASAMRLLEQEPLRNGVVVCSSTRGGQISPKHRIPLNRSGLFNIPNMTYAEFHNLARFYMLQKTTEVLNEEQIKKCFFLLGANPKEYKVYAGGFDWEF